MNDYVADGLIWTAKNRDNEGSVSHGVKQQIKQTVMSFNITKSGILKNMKKVADSFSVVVLDGSGFEKQEGGCFCRLLWIIMAEKNLMQAIPYWGEVKVGKSKVKSSTQHRPIYDATIEGFKALRGTISKGEIINAEKIYRGEKRYDIHCCAY